MEIIHCVLDNMGKAKTHTFNIQLKFDQNLIAIFFKSNTKNQLMKPVVEDFAFEIFLPANKWKHNPPFHIIESLKLHLEQVLCMLVCIWVW